MPMLAKVANSVQQLWDAYRPRPFTLQWKYDGMRSQIHFDIDSGAAHEAVFIWRARASHTCKLWHVTGVQIFSRHLDDCTARFPDVVKVITEVMTTASDDVVDAVHSAVIDAELVAVSMQPPPAASAAASSSSSAPAYRILPFQALSTRARTAETAAAASSTQVSVCIFAFDLLLLNGSSWCNKPYRTRKQVKRNAAAHKAHS